jgi:predicted permease
LSDPGVGDPGLGDPWHGELSAAERRLIALVIAFPPSFRKRFGAGVRYALVRDYRSARGRGRIAGAAWWLRAAGSLVLNGVVERVVGGGRKRAPSEGPGKQRPAANGREGMMSIEPMIRELSSAVRRLARRPGFALAAVATLAVGIGPTTAILSVVDGVLLEPLPYPEPDRLVRIVQQNSPDNRWNISLADFLAIEEEQAVFESVAAIQVTGAVLTGRGAPERITVGRVSADWLRVLGVEPSEGRDFLPDEDRPGAEPAVILASAFRDRVFGPRADALGEAVTLDGAPHTVVGVLDPGHASLAGTTADAWPILRLDTPPRRGPFFLRGVARLRADRTLEDARSDLDAVSRRIFSVWADTGFRDGQARLTPYPLEELIVGNVGSGLWLMLAGVAGVLLIAVSNVGGLFLVRAAEREGEMALRASLGATGFRLAGQLVVEGVLIAMLGGAAGALLAWLGLQGFLATNPTLPRLGQVGLDVSVLAIIASVTLGSGVLFGLAPLGRIVFAAGVLDPSRGSRSAGHSVRATRLRAGVVTAQFAIAFSLTAGAGLLVGSFVRLQRVDPGYDSEGVVAMQLSLPEGGYDDTQAFWREALRRVEELPGVAAVGVGSALPPAGSGSAGTNDFDLLDQPVPEGESQPYALWNWAGPGYLRALGVQLQRGRFFEEADREGEPVVLVSESWARRFYPAGDAVGAQLYAGGDRSVAMTVIGVTGDVKYLGLDAANDEAVYEPHWQATMRTGWLVLRSRTRPDENLLDAVRREIALLDPDIPISDVQTMDERTSESLARPRQWTVLLGLFAALGLALACVGVYGVLSYYVSTQRKEIGVRVSLGAEPARVRRLVVARGMTLAALGITIGLGVSLVAARWLRSVVFGLSPRDPTTLALVALGMTAVALVACALPAVRATRIDPASTLKE